MVCLCKKNMNMIYSDSIVTIYHCINCGSLCKKMRSVFKEYDYQWTTPQLTKEYTNFKHSTHL